MPNEFVARNGIIALNNSSITGSLGVSSGITGSLFGTASWASNAVTSSYILNAVSASFASTASFVNPLRQNVIITGSLIITSSAVSTIAGNPTFDGDSVLTIKNNNPSSFPTQVLALDSVRSDTPVDIKLGSSTPKGIRIYADNQVLTSSPAGAGFQFYRITDTSFPGQVYFDSGAHNNAAIIFRTAITSGTITERARFTSAGRLLVGTATESTYIIDANGTVRVQGTELRLDNGTTGTLNIYSNTPTINFFSGGGYSIGRSSTSLQMTSAGNIAFFIGANQGYGLDATNGHIFRTAIAGGAALARLDTGGSLSIGNSSTAANASSILDLTSTTKGFLPPRMTLAQRTAISSPAVGLIAYETGSATTEGVWVYESTGWQQLLTNSGSQSISGSLTLTGTLTAQTLVVQTITSSVSFITGSTRFGSLSSNTHQFTGSVSITGSLTATGSVNIAGGVSASGNIYQGGTGNASTVLASSGNTALFTLSSTGATINMGRVGAISLLANSTDGGIVMNDGAYLGVSSGTLRIGSNLAANNVVIGNFANSTATINGNTTISGSTVITGSFTVITGSAVEFQVTNTGVRIGNASTDTHTVTGSFNISGSGFVHGGGFIVSGTLATSGSTSQGLVAPLKFTTAPVNTNYTLVYTDEGKMVEMNYNVDAPLLVTIPLNSSVSFPIGTEISIIQIGGGTTIITGSAGVTVNSYLGYKTIGAQYGVASIVKRGTDSWYLFGNLS